MNVFASILFLSLAWLLHPALRAQNLVPNGSFEDYRVCPGSYSQDASEFSAVSWRSINTGSPDYFNTCSEGEAAVPYNWAGVSDPFDGYGYVGIYTWMDLAKNYREYIHCKLSEPLLKDSLYHVEFRYKLSSYSKYCTDRIGLLLSDSMEWVPNDRPLAIAPTVTFLKDSALTPETGAWEHAVTEYKAKGNEQFLTIGNFADNAETHYYYIRFRPASEPMLAQSAYYYIDDVKVTPLFSTEPEMQTPPVFTGGDPELNTIYILKKIQFEFNSYSLMPVSYEDLDNVSRYLLDNPAIKVRLAGHTDDIGSEEYNQMLSARRAESAASYLISRGVADERILTTGYGEVQPLLAEENEQARRINRRVEIEFYR